MEWLSNFSSKTGRRRWTWTSTTLQNGSELSGEQSSNMRLQCLNRLKIYFYFFSKNKLFILVTFKCYHLFHYSSCQWEIGWFNKKNYIYCYSDKVANSSEYWIFDYLYIWRYSHEIRSKIVKCKVKFFMFTFWLVLIFWICLWT
jgi:hypothetical protein